MRRICRDIFATVVLIGIVVAIGCVGKKAKPEPNRVYFEIDSLYKMIVMPVTINDTVTARMAFDTGCHWGCFDLDSTFCSSHPLHLWQQTPDYVWPFGVSSAWVHESNPGSMFHYEKDFTVKMGETNVEYKRLYVSDMEGHFGKVSHNGLFTIPQSDTTHVWELNFEHNYLELHDADTFTMPEDCLIAPIVAGKPQMNITIPMEITTSDGEILTVNRDFLVDSGMGWDIAFVPPAEEVSFFEGKEAVPFHYGGGGYVNRHIVDAEIFGNFHVDSLRIYVLKERFRLPTGYWVGLNFLKRFNVFIDVKNGRIGLQPLKEFHRAFSPIWKRFSIDLSKTDRGSYMVTELADHDLNHYKAAGFEVGDEIVAINGYTLTPEATQEKARELLNTYKVVFDIIRAGEHMSITMERDPNEIHGD
jgi:hypothetical protein